jgi:glycosyltransferase involved in cell wall biosynthesis
MKIAFLHQPLNTMDPSHPDGSTTIWIHEVANRLAQFHKVVVYAKKFNNESRMEYRQKVQYRYISALVDEKCAELCSAIEKRLLRFNNSKCQFFASRLYYLIYALRVAKNLRSEKCDIVHVENFSQFVPIIRAFNPKIKIVLHMHCEWLTQLDRKMIECRLRNVDLIIGCSEYITEKIRRAFPQFAERCQTIYNGVDIHRFACEKSKSVLRKDGIKRILFVGRISPEKGLHVLLEAFRKVVDHDPKTNLTIIGSRQQLPIRLLIALSHDKKVLALSSFYNEPSNQLSYFRHLQQKLSLLKISNAVAFTGYVSYSQVVNYYRNADIVVNPSFSEAFGRSLIEAMACELPVVSTRVGGMTEIISEGETGILVNSGDYMKMAKAILKLLSDVTLRGSMGKAARERVVRLFSWEKIVEDLLCCYKKLTSRER